MLSRYLAGRQVKAKTMDGYESLVNARILPRWGPVRLDQVAGDDVSAWITDLQRGDDAVSAARARQAGIILRAALQLAVVNRMLPENPAAGVDLPAGSAKRKGVRLSAAELWKVADEMPTEVDRALLLTLALTGVRWGEVTALMVGAVDVDRRRLTVERTYTDLNGEIVEGVPKNHATRWVPAAPTVIEALRPLLKGKTATDDVFRTSSGAVLRHRNWGRRVFRPALGRAGCDESMRIHDLRGTAASLAISAGANILALQRMLGHESAALTLDVYGALYEDDLTGLAEKIDSAAYSLRTGGESDQPRSASISR
ncbi:tyrosine-type recombinase/integrase [Nesterenkonia marinintestina]|uniref:tyrosine-type recombinase/integrase n=1 Tax=Nesterenkonia marinintestina TaxID=2979865 RepID=UPI0021BE4763|nr:site-specific integrase [Nesterenkonia sp. GX14115]